MSGTRDLTGLVERVAARLHADGVAHPVAAALARSVRGRFALDLDAFATNIGLPLGLVARCEDGEIAFADLPDALVDRIGQVDLFALADLDRWYREADLFSRPSNG